MGLKKKKNGGFTLVEMLVVAAILMILLAFGFVEIVKHSRYLKVTEMDNMARSIYLAAENRAVALAKNGQLTEDYLIKDLGSGGPGGVSLADMGISGNLCYVKSPGANLGNLIPVGTIDPTLRDSSFYVVYDVNAGSVKDVFFDAQTSGENFDAAFSFAGYGLSGSTDFGQFYQYWSKTEADTSRATRANNKIYIGHYRGEMAPPPDLAGSAPKDPIELKPTIKIVNGEELKLYVTYVSANDAGEVRAIDDADINGWELDVKLTYGKRTVTLPLNQGVQLPGYTWTYTLDALGEGSPHFKDLVWKKDNGDWMTDTEKDAAGVRSLGGVFEVKAVMKEKADGDFVGERANLIAIPAIERKANSLFDDATNNSGVGNAIISNLRHLQNLDEAFSGVLNKTAAIQVADIEADKLKDDAGNVVKANYQFKPISNSQLMTYKSSFKGTAGGEKEYCSIKNLTVTITDNTVSGAGLFAKADGKRDASGNMVPFKFENVWLVNASVDGGGQPAGSIVGMADHVSFNNVRVINAAVNGGTAPAGGVVGTATDANFGDCRVYWTDTAKLEKDGKLQYKILSNEAAGGLVGKLSGGTIAMSFAATTIQGNKDIGGLIGYANGVTIEKAYADCYLKGESADLRAGGLIGSAGSGSDTTLTNVYSTGFIEWTKTTSDSKVAGFCADGSVTATNAYSGVYYQAKGNSSELAGGGAQAFGRGVITEKCYAAWGAGSNSGYEGLKSLRSAYNGDDRLSGNDAFESKNNSPNSHPYRLGNNSGLGNYEAPGIVGLPHYGDWTNGNQGGLPIVWVENGEELVAYIQTKGGKVSPGTVPTASSFTRPRVKLCYGDNEVEISETNIEYKGCEVVSTTESEVLWSVTLDALNGPHFEGWWSSASSAPSSFGGDFSVLASTDGSTWTKGSASSTANSLFASGTVTMMKKGDKDIPVSISSEETVYIENLRHLQNLNAATSGVGDSKKAAVQTADIDAKGNAGYSFIPIKNASLQSYSVSENKVGDDGTVLQGQYVKIDNLKVTEESSVSSGNATGAGLFSEVMSTKNGDDTLKPFTFENVTIGTVNVAVTSPSKSAGALVGTAKGAVEFKNCKTGVTTVSSADAAGGLVGYVTGKVTFDGGCAVGSVTAGEVRATIAGVTAAGGLVGKVSGKSVISGFTMAGGAIAATGGAAGGLVGTADGGLNFNNCKVLGAISAGGGAISIQANGSAGGLVGDADGKLKFSGCKVVGTISGSGGNISIQANGNAGGLVGNAGGGADFYDCEVYWEKQDGGFMSPVVYQILGQNAGGLAGQLKGGDIISSYAATFVSGNSGVGGLVGNVTGNDVPENNVMVAGSYADCYLTGSGNVGGLIGSVGAGGVSDVTLKEVYSAGFIDCTNATSVAGLCAAGTVRAMNAYSAMYYTNLDSKQPKPLGEVSQADGADGTNGGLYFVAYRDINYDEGSGIGLTYSAMAGTEIEDFSGKPTASNPYNLEGSSGKLADYHLPGLKLPHYGDWKVDLPDVKIENGDVLKVTVTTVSGCGPVVVLSYGEKWWLDISGKGVQTGGVWTLTLDGSNGLHFKDCASWGQWQDSFGNNVASPDGFGGDFEIRASYAGETLPTKAKSNSLFAEGTADGTAQISNLRHLQNLDFEFSGVKGITAAVQTGDIDLKDCSFRPIVNDELRSYDGKGKSINGLKVVNPRKLGGDTDSKLGAGLFARVIGTREKPFEFNNVNISGADIAYSDSGSTVTDGDVILAGALAGEAVGNIVVSGCNVTGQTRGKIAGGLIGQVSAVSENDVSGGDVSFNNCVVDALTVSGGTAGGLVGYMGYDVDNDSDDRETPTLNVTISGCEIKGSEAAMTEIKGNQRAGGFAGGIHGSILFKNCVMAAGGYEISVVDSADRKSGKYFGAVTGGSAVIEPETENNDIPSVAADGSGRLQTED